MTDVLAPVVKVRDLPCPPEVAFALFTDRISEWWPTESHSVARDRVRKVVVEPLAGGHIYETDDTGTRHDWATVVIHAAPHRLLLDWYAGNTPAEATRVEITFTETASGCTLRLVHDGFTADGPRGGYDKGWDVVLAPLVTAAAA
jgi:uncharacterized protein YndB with AHSA1/START domain